MAFLRVTKKGSNWIPKYGLFWPINNHPASIEMDMIRKGGRFVTPRTKKLVGNGLVFHYRELIKTLWPDILWHRWNQMIVDEYPDHRTICIIGPASSGKTNTAALLVLADYYCFPSCTTVIVCSTTRERLEDRVWGEIKSLHKRAKARVAWLPGNLIEGRQRLVTDHKSMAEEGRDFRNGVVGVACKKGADYVGLGDFAGLKNKRVRLLGDELSLLPRAFVDALSNLDKNPDFKALGLGNPKDTLDALGILAEPSAELGGWEGGVDQVEKSKTWKTKRPSGVCIQLVGTDSPNLDGKLGIPLIDQAAIERDISFYSRDSLHFTMMNLGMMPRGQGSRRVITREMCRKFGALEQPIWKTNTQTQIGFLDAAYRGVGGDRCVFGHISFGEEGIYAANLPGNELISAILSQRTDIPPGRKILYLVDLVIVPLKVRDTVGAPVNEVEDQITDFCMTQCKQRNIPPENFFYDSGMRTSLVTSMTRLWSTQTNPIDCGGKPSDRKVSEGIDIMCKDYYSKRITEFWYSVRLTIEAGQFRGMRDDVMNEGCMREYKSVGANKIEVETKDEMKAKTGRSPDLFDALAIGVEGARQRGFSIGKLAKPRPNRRNGEADWRDDLRTQAKKIWSSGELNYTA